MSSTIVLTDEIRKIPYFAYFSSSEKEVIIPRRYVNESINYEKIQDNIDITTLVTIIENRAYLGLENDELIRELIWILGETESLMKSIDTMSSVIHAELKPYLSHPDYIYVYGIRCRIKLDNNCPCSNAALVGNLRLLKWLVDNGFITDKTKENWVCEKAALNGHLEVLQWARDTGFCCNTYAISNAAKNGHLECLKYIVENMANYLSDIRMAIYLSNIRTAPIWAAKNGCLECLKYLHKKGINMVWGDITLGAVRYGHINILEYGKECMNNFYWKLEFLSGESIVSSEYLSGEAALNGHLHILKHLHENKCSWDEDTCANAAYNGHIECLKYARENGCPWDKETYENALLNNHYSIVQYAIDNGCPT